MTSNPTNLADQLTSEQIIHNITAAAIPLPTDASADDWTDNGGQPHRLIYGDNRGIDSRPDVILFPSAVQLGDGTVDNGDRVEAPVLYVDVDGQRGFTAVQARALSTALVDAAGLLDRWEHFVPG